MRLIDLPSEIWYFQVTVLHAASGKRLTSQCWVLLECVSAAQTVPRVFFPCFMPLVRGVLSLGDKSFQQDVTFEEITTATVRAFPIGDFSLVLTGSVR